MALFFVTLALILSAITLAMWLGDWPEKAGALIISAQVIANVIGFQIVAFHYVKIDPIGAIADTAGFLSFCAIALHARRIWPLWVSSLQLITVMAHVVRALAINIHPVAYAMMSWAPSDLIPLTLIWGTANHWRRKRMGVNKPPWRNWSGHSNPKVPKN